MRFIFLTYVLALFEITKVMTIKSPSQTCLSIAQSSSIHSLWSVQIVPFYLQLSLPQNQLHAKSVHRIKKIIKITFQKHNIQFCKAVITGKTLKSNGGSGSFFMEKRRNRKETHLPYGNNSVLQLRWKFTLISWRKGIY